MVPKLLVGRCCGSASGSSFPKWELLCCGSASSSSLFSKWHSPPTLLLRFCKRQQLVGCGCESGAAHGVGCSSGSSSSLHCDGPVLQFCERAIACGLWSWQWQLMGHGSVGVAARRSSSRAEGLRFCKRHRPFPWRELLCCGSACNVFCKRQLVILQVAQPPCSALVLQVAASFWAAVVRAARPWAVVLGAAARSYIVMGQCCSSVGDSPWAAVLGSGSSWATHCSGSGMQLVKIVMGQCCSCASGSLSVAAYLWQCVRTNGTQPSVEL